MAGKRSVRGCRPRHLKTTGKGWGECDASGFIRHIDDLQEDVKQGRVSEEFADSTPGFGTWHPQDIKNLGPFGDPSPIPEANPADTDNFSKQDLGISDKEIELSIREGRVPRRGY